MIPESDSYLLSLTRQPFSLSGKILNLALAFISAEHGLDLPPAGIVEDDDPVRDIDEALDDDEDSFTDDVFDLVAFKLLLCLS